MKMWLYFWAPNDIGIDDAPSDADATSFRCAFGLFSAYTYFTAASISHLMINKQFIDWN